MIPIATTTAPSAPHSVLTPAHILSMDIETGHADEKTIEAAVARWSPPANIKDPVKIEDRRQEYITKTREKSALLDGAPIVCIAVRTEKVGVIFNGIDKKKHKVEHSEVLSCGSERGMLEAFRGWLDSNTSDGTLIVGWNILSFDLPRLRAAFMRHRLRLPRILSPRILDDERQPVVDAMRTFVKWFSAELQGDIMCSLDEAIERLGLPRYKDRVDGSKIPDMVRDGQVKEVLSYCGVDTMAAQQIFLLMTSAAPDME